MWLAWLGDINFEDHLFQGLAQRIFNSLYCIHKNVTALSPLFLPGIINPYNNYIPKKKKNRASHLREVSFFGRGPHNSPCSTFARVMYNTSSRPGSVQAIDGAAQARAPLSRSRHPGAAVGPVLAPEGVLDSGETSHTFVQRSRIGWNGVTFSCLLATVACSA